MLVCDLFRCLLEQCTSVLFTMSADTRFRSGMLIVPMDRDTMWESLSRPT